jgi:hypothetical protein
VRPREPPSSPRKGRVARSAPLRKTASDGTPCVIADTMPNCRAFMQMRHATTKSVSCRRAYGTVQLTAEQNLPICQSILPESKQGLDSCGPAGGQIRGGDRDGGEQSDDSEVGRDVVRSDTEE